ncbi:MAG TPA: RNA polymerase subunit sigma, partial [Sphingobacteriaceae bacterium]|nr:RNA polymerase subunit sigma [Sphingobacteriaceae bacterium]
MCQQMDEQGIISKILLGNKELFTELVERYKYFVFTIALKFTDDRQNAEDIAQDVFIKAYKSLADFQHKAKFSTWLY